MNSDVKVVRDPDDVKIAIEDTRSDILSLLRVNDMTITQIAENLNKDHSTIYRHIKKLQEAGYVKEISQMKDNHIPKKVYTRTADAFLLSPTSIDGGEPSELMMDWEIENARKILELLEIMGYSVDADEEEMVDILSKIFVELKEKVSKPIEEAEDEIGELSFPLLMRFELLMFLLEKRKSEDIEEKFEKLLTKLDID
ncbi:MAG: ArsR family transcriptional regulator [Candidatus Thermoplasmatota archaeon]|nr:ArsR family transcriptional regulator [Candidatus Thermoplasmatota archaeon]MBS3789796.1 ArsR family transcriptional regulator [Candidatus Thermoplasmatota archaeon]